jgi:2'-5' RNA ligase
MVFMDKDCRRAAPLYNFSMPATTPAPDGNARLFLTLWPAPQLRSELLAHQRAWHWQPGASLVRPEKLHLTLHFIGAVPRQRLASLMAGLKVPVTPFELDFGQPALWHGGLAVLQPHAPPAGLLQLHEALGQALLGLALPVESRPLHPHVTLARHAAGAQPPARAPLLRWPVRGYALVESVPAPANIYRLLQHYT